MAKELPFFKFEPSAWDTGKIQLVEKDIQGYFINLCSLYWQRVGDLPYKLALQKVCDRNATVLQTLCDEGVIEIRDDFIYIKFLDDQLSEFENISEVNRKNALKRWDDKGKKATAMRPQCDRNAIREEKRREEKKREDIKEREQNFYSELKSFKLKYSRELLLNFASYWTEPNKSKTKMRFELEKTWDLSRRVANWASRDKNFKPTDEPKIYKGVHPAFKRKKENPIRTNKIGNNEN